MPDGLVFELGLRPGAPPLARYRSGDVAIPAEEAKALARREGTTLRALIEAGLRQVLRERRRRSRFRLRDGRFEGRGLQPGFRDAFGDADWARMREAAYEDRGG